MNLSLISMCAGILLATFADTTFAGTTSSAAPAAANTSIEAATPAPLRTELTLTHIAADKWRADYVFAEPVTAIDLGPQIGPFRKQAWRLLTPGVALITREDNESLRSATPLSKLSVEISRYDDFELAHYAPINHFSDGGSDFYLGFLHGAL